MWCMMYVSPFECVLFSVQACPGLSVHVLHVLISQ